MNVEEILGSKGKVKILKVIYSFGETNITHIVRETKLNHKTVSNHLKYLVDKGIVNERVIGRIKMYSINFSNPKTLALKDIFSVIEE